jgi:hypothetical protein
MPNIKQTSTDTTRPECPKLPQPAKKAHATVETKKTAQCPKNVWSNPLYIKLQFLPTTTVHFKHTLVLLKTLLKLDNTTTKLHLICTRKGTHQNLVNMSDS